MQVVIEIPDEREAAEFIIDMLDFGSEITGLLTPLMERRVHARLVPFGNRVKKMVEAYRAIDFDEPYKPYTLQDVVDKLVDAIQ